MIYLQISTAQGPAECRIFARFVLKKLLAEAEARNVKAEIAGETADKHGILSAVLMLEGAAADTLAQSWQGTLQWVCASPVRLKNPRKNWYIGIFRLPEKQSRPSAPLIKRVVFPCGWKANAASMPTKNVRWNSWHTNWPNIKPHKMPIMPNSSTAVCIR